MGSSFQVLFIKLLNSTRTFQNLSSHCLLGIRLFNHARTSEEYINTIPGYLPMSRPNHYIIMMVSICTGEYCIRPSAKLWLGQCIHVMSNRTSAKIIIRQYFSLALLSLSHSPSLATQCLAIVTSSLSIHSLSCALQKICIGLEIRICDEWSGLCSAY